MAMQPTLQSPQEARRPRRGQASSTRSSQPLPSRSARSENTLAFSVSAALVGIIMWRRLRQ